MSKKAITLIGMSGVGKTYLSSKLAEWGWLHFSCDLDIARTIFPSDPDITAGDISKLSDFLGKLGDPAKGGMDYDTFKERQQIYNNAEKAALKKVPAEMSKAGEQSFIHDSTGSFCEILDQDVIRQVAQNTLIVYIKGSAAEEQELIRRAQEYPKPLFFPPEEFDGWLAEYMQGQGLASSAQIDPDDFSRWVFPKLLESRKPKYQAIANKHGITIPSAAFQEVASEDEFLDVIARSGATKQSIGSV